MDGWMDGRAVRWEKAPFLPVQEEVAAGGPVANRSATALAELNWRPACSQLPIEEGGGQGKEVADLQAPQRPWLRPTQDT